MHSSHSGIWWSRAHGDIRLWPWIRFRLFLAALQIVVISLVDTTNP